MGMKWMSRSALNINYNKKVGKSGVMWGIVSNFVAEFRLVKCTYEIFRQF